MRVVFVIVFFCRWRNYYSRVPYVHTLRMRTLFYLFSWPVEEVAVLPTHSAHARAPCPCLFPFVSGGSGRFLYVQNTARAVLVHFPVELVVSFTYESCALTFVLLYFLGEEIGHFLWYTCHTHARAFVLVYFLFGFSGGSGRARRCSGQGCR